MQTQQLVAAKIPFIAIRCKSAVAVILRQRIFRRCRQEKIVQGIMNAASQLLATLAISGMLLGGVYVFLVQLAEHGW